MITLKKKTLCLCVATLALPMMAQDIYKVENFSNEDLTGTARYVGMGGAMNALGADISTMGSNPAGIGMYRRSDVSITGTITTQPNAKSMDDIDKVRGSLDQAGFVFSTPINSDKLKYLNFGFNYQKRRNMKNFIGLNNVPLMGGMSQTDQMRDLASFYGHWNDGSGEFQSPLAEVGYNSYLIDDDGNDGYIGSTAQNYSYNRAQHGSIQQFDFNISTNYNDQLYLGLTLGVYNVNWYSLLDYREALVSGTNVPNSYLTNDEVIKGTGFDVKLGAIVRPFEYDPFRIGFTVSTPIWFDLTGNNILSVSSPNVGPDSTAAFTEAGLRTGDFDYRITTPWKFNFSMGTTIAGTVALDAEYEYRHQTGTSVRYPDGGFFDNHDGWTKTYKDRSLGYEIDNNMKDVHTIRVGAEARVVDGLLVRAGYNYVSSPFKDNAIKNMYWGTGFDNPHMDDMSVYNTTGTDYVNLGDINRLTAGIGFYGNNWYCDFAYQYQMQKGDVYAFHTFDGSNIRTNNLQKQTFDLNRHNFTLTLGYKF